LAGKVLRATPLPEDAAEAGHEDEHQCGEQPGDDRLATAPADDALRGAHRARPDRLPGEEAPQIVGQGLGCGIALAGVLAKALQTDRFQVAWNGRLETPGRHRLLLLYLDHRR